MKVRVTTAALFGLLFLAASSCNVAPDAITPNPMPSPTPTLTPAFQPSPSPSHTNTPAPAPTFDPGQSILPTIALPTHTPTPTQRDIITSAMDSIGSRVSIFRGIFALKPVERDFIKRDKYIADLRIELKEDHEHIYLFQQLLVALGLLSETDDLLELMIGLQGEDVIGFFDTQDERLYIVDDGSAFGPYQHMIYAHEFVHALQQDRFDIRAISESLKHNSDRSRAFHALVEGDATFSHTIYVFQHIDQDQRDTIVEAIQARPREVFDSAPYLLQRTTNFPYVEGASFVFELYATENNWEAG